MPDTIGADGGGATTAVCLYAGEAERSAGALSKGLDVWQSQSSAEICKAPASLSTLVGQRSWVLISVNDSGCSRIDAFTSKMQRQAAGQQGFLSDLFYPLASAGRRLSLCRRTHPPKLTYPEKPLITCPEAHTS